MVINEPFIKPPFWQERDFHDTICKFWVAVSHPACSLQTSPYSKTICFLGHKLPPRLLSQSVHADHGPDAQIG